MAGILHSRHWAYAGAHRANMLELCKRLRMVYCVTIYAFAIENFNRPKEETDTIMQLSEKRLVEISQKGEILDRYGRAVEKNMIQICAPYTSQDEITTAVNDVIREAIDAGDLDGSTITEDTIHSHLSTSPVGSPPLDVFVRTSGVKRLSNFMTWQCREGAQMHMANTPWPEFGPV